MYRVGILVWAAAAALVVLVALPLAFVVLQAIFPNLGQGSLSEPFTHLFATLADRQLLGLAGNTLLLGAELSSGRRRSECRSACSEPSIACLWRRSST